MASTGLQLLGFFLALVGLGATIAATVMVEWKKQHQENTHPIYEGLWTTCSENNERTICEFHQQLLKLSTEVQATRAVMLLSIFISAVAVLVSTVGMKCTHFLDGRPKSKSTAAMVGGIMFMVAGLLIIIITSWYVRMIVRSANQSHHLQSFEFGKAVFVSWVGGLLSLAGGGFLSCRTCWQSDASESLSASHFFPTSNQVSNYV
ncbi:claudin-19 [Brachionichthys hirsutus]|uniref:claudin-19 n=1 Tax=Brachionichthys hirsutus TaxID=412623 RepID=UPI003604A379